MGRLIKKVSADARKQSKRAVLTLAAVPFWLSGFLAAIVVSTFLWCLGAVLVGWHEGRK